MPKCKLCDQDVANLINSHIIPRSTHVELKDNEGKNLRAVMPDQDVRINQSDLKELMLCLACETKFSVFENAAITLLREISKLRNPFAFTFQPSSVTDIVRFVQSVFWRASVSARCDNFKLPGETEERLRKALNAGVDILPPELAVQVKLIDPTRPLGTGMILSPWRERFGPDLHVSYFSAYGLLFTMHDPIALHDDPLTFLKQGSKGAKVGKLSPTETETIVDLLEKLRHLGRYRSS